MRGRQWFGAVLLGAVVLVPSLASAAGAETSGGDDHAVDRVLIISLPYVSWSELDDADVPHLRALLDSSSVANLSTRGPSLSSTLAAGYVTLGSGDKGVATETPEDGLGMEATERFAGGTAGQAFGQRTGRDPGGGLVHLGISEIVDANDASIFGADVGALGDALARAHVERTVIANGDSEQPPERGTIYRRDAVAALMGSDGQVPTGTVDDRLLEDDSSAPFGVRLDHDAVLRAFDGAWTGRAVVLVEASDLVRADAFLSFASDAAGRQAKMRALHSTDELIGQLLQRVDAGRDAVVVVGPSTSTNQRTLTVAAVRAPGFGPSLLRSPTTQRTGYAQLIDVAPTLLHLLDVDVPTSMRGRVLEAAGPHGSAADRWSSLADGDEAARFRTEIGTPTTMLLIALEGVLVFAVLLALTCWQGLRQSRVLCFVASALLASIPLVYLARAAPFHELGSAPYFAFVVGLSALLGVSVQLVCRGRAVDAALAGVSAIVVVLVADVVLLGSNLQFDAAFGSSPEIAGRFIGFGNISFAALSAAALLGAAFVAHRLPRYGVGLALALLAMVLVVDGAPMWGADVGGVLSLVMTFGVTALLLLGRRPSARVVAGFAAATVVGVTIAAVIDLLQPASERTHLGRLVEQVHGEGSSAFTSVVVRKLDMNLASITTSPWRSMVPIGVAFVIVLVLVRPPRLRALLDRVPELRAALIGFTVLLVLGDALNDSGITVPGMMFAVLCPTLTLLVLPERIPATELRTSRSRHTEEARQEHPGAGVSISSGRKHDRSGVRRVPVE